MHIVNVMFMYIIVIVIAVLFGIVVEKVKYSKYLTVHNHYQSEPFEGVFKSKISTYNLCPECLTFELIDTTYDATKIEDKTIINDDLCNTCKKFDI